MAHTEKTLPRLAYDDLPEIATLEQIACYYSGKTLTLKSRIRRLAILTAFDDVMTRLGAEREADGRGTARYRIFTRFGEWSANVDPDDEYGIWIFSRFDENDRGSPAFNQYSGKWNHTLKRWDGSTDEFDWFEAMCRSRGVVSLTGAALERERLVYLVRQVMGRGRRAFSWEMHPNLTDEQLAACKADKELEEQLRLANIYASKMDLFKQPNGLWRAQPKNVNAHPYICGHGATAVLALQDAQQKEMT